MEIDNKNMDPGTLAAFADIYQKVKILNESVLKLIDILMTNRMITYPQANEILRLIAEQISDEEERKNHLPVPLSARDPHRSFLWRRWKGNRQEIIIFWVFRGCVDHPSRE